MQKVFPRFDLSQFKCKGSFFSFRKKLWTCVLIGNLDLILKGRQLGPSLGFIYFSKKIL